MTALRKSFEDALEELEGIIKELKKGKYEDTETLKERIENRKLMLEMEEEYLRKVGEPEAPICCLRSRVGSEGPLYSCDFIKDKSMDELVEKCKACRKHMKTVLIPDIHAKLKVIDQYL